MSRSKPETALSKSIRETLEDLGFWVERLQAGKLKVSRGWLHCCSPGTPDLMVLSPIVAFIEVKVPGGKLNSDQIAWHAKARAAGLEVHVFDSLHGACRQAMTWLKRPTMRIEA